MTLPYHTRIELMSKTIKELESELARKTRHFETAQSERDQLEVELDNALAELADYNEFFSADRLDEARERKASRPPSKADDDFAKDDDKKPRLNLLPPLALMAIGRVLTIGARKYGPGNWRKCPDLGRYTAALLRHVAAYMAGEEVDPETGESHMAHAACCTMFIIDLDETRLAEPEGEDEEREEGPFKSFYDDLERIREQMYEATASIRRAFDDFDVKTTLTAAGACDGQGGES